MRDSEKAGILQYNDIIAFLFLTIFTEYMKNSTVEIKTYQARNTVHIIQIYTYTRTV